MYKTFNVYIKALEDVNINKINCDKIMGKNHAQNTYCHTLHLYSSI